MRTMQKKLLLAILLCLSLTSLSGCRALPTLSRPVSGIAIAIDPAEPSQIAIDWDPADLPMERIETAVTETDTTITIHLLPPKSKADLLPEIGFGGIHGGKAP